MREVLARAVLAAVLVASAACGGSDGGGSGGLTDPAGPGTTPPASNPPPSQSTVDTVRLSGTSFLPATLTVRPGRTVVWVNEDAMLHTVTPQGHSQWSSASRAAPGEMLRVTFGTAGTFPYFCEPHRSSGMTGVVTVQP